MVVDCKRVILDRCAISRSRRLWRFAIASLNRIEVKSRFKCYHIFVSSGREVSSAYTMILALLIIFWMFYSSTWVA